MKKTTTITYNVETTQDGVSMRELEYKDYVKNEKGEENLLHYKVKNNVSPGDETGTNGAVVIGESFNKIYKIDNRIDETVGVSNNCDDWKIHEYKNHQLDKEYKQSYDTITFDVKNELLESGISQSYIKDKE
jgi:hypothetical protein